MKHFFGRANHTLHRGTFKEFLELQHLRLSKCAMAQENKQYEQILHKMVNVFHNLKDLTYLTKLTLYIRTSPKIILLRYFTIT